MPVQEYMEQEIDLRDYIKVIIRRKTLILNVFFVAVITAIALSFLMPKAYEVTSTIQIGSIDEVLMSKEEAKEMLLSQDSLAPTTKELNLDIKPEQLKENIKIEDIKDTNLLKIKVQYSNSDMAVKINKMITDSFVSQRQGIYQERLSLINERLRELEIEVKNVQDNIKKTQDLTAQLSTASGIAQQEVSLRLVLLQNTLPNYEAHLTNLMNQKNDLKMLLSKAKDFKVTDFPLKPGFPIKPKKTQNVAIAGLLGLMLGIFIAFFQEFWQRGKKVAEA